MRQYSRTITQNFSQISAFVSNIVLGSMWYMVLLSTTFCWGNQLPNTDIYAATTTFSVELIQKILEQNDGNFIVSPVSVHALLAMLQQGAGGNTKDQLDQVINADEVTTREGYHNLTRHYQRSGRFTNVEFASKMFLRIGFDVKSPFKSSMVNDFMADVDLVDFADADAATQHINNWVTESTHNHITELFQPGKIRSDSVLVLINVIFFKSFWDNPFWITEDRNFSPDPNTVLQVPTMYQHEFYEAGESSELGVKWLHLSFENNNEYTLLLVLPTERHGLNSLRQLTHDNWTSIFAHQGFRRVQTYVPKFKLKEETKLVPLITSLGAEDMFGSAANLSGISTQDTKVTEMMQKATIAIDENGVTASAATGAVIQPESLFIVPGAEEMEFRADHPFLVFIIDRIHGIPLFAGRVTNPLNE